MDAVTAFPLTAPPLAEPLFLDLPPLRPALIDGVRLLCETIIAPTLIFALVDATSGLVAGLLASLAWCWLAVGIRWWRGKGTPGTLLLSTGMYTARTGVSLATASAFLYLAQPAMGSLVMAALFIGTCFASRPLALRLAHDFIHLPQHLLARSSVRRMFRDVTLIWGASRLIAGGLTLLALFHSTALGLLTRGVGAPALTVVSVGACAWWGIRALRADGIRLRLHRTAAAA
jgi:hypothetical protein